MRIDWFVLVVCVVAAVVGGLIGGTEWVSGRLAVGLEQVAFIARTLGIAGLVLSTVVALVRPSAGSAVTVIASMLMIGLSYVAPGAGTVPGTGPDVCATLSQHPELAKALAYMAPPLAALVLLVGFGVVRLRKGHETEVL